MSTKAPILDVKNIDITYKKDKLKIIENGKFHVDAGEVVLILGENGIGKSTLLNALIGSLDQAEVNKEIYFEGELIDSHSKLEYFRQSIGYAEQKDDDNPLFYSRVKDYVLNYAKSAVNNEGYKEYYEDLYNNKLQCENYYHPVNLNKKFLKKCSGGQLKLISLLKTFSRNNAKLYILDEPINNLDANHARILNDFITDLKHEGNAGVLIVTHCQMFGNVDRAYVFKNHKLEQLDSYSPKSCFGECVNGYYNKR